MTTKPYQYDTERYDDLGGLDTLSMDLPPMDRDAIEKVEWDVRYGYRDDAEDFGMEPGEPFMYIDTGPWEKEEAVIPSKDVNEVHLEILERLVEEEEPALPEEKAPDEGESIHVATLKATWKRFKGRWRLGRFGFEMNEENVR